ncbi:hypothetical protein TNIN_168041 [Trichonephila inaurata madagascariensis]|uniref:Uncharacterized protein n=1 Tax=Trichonephila inaurata madagascariensis TaxID=2747483 RepID=A0A8X6WLC5_9ARAC|nr:hypothetical protein TNIN_168041 [Trichonephila inaurata madagascariensis]
MRDKSNEDPRIVLRAMYGRNADDIDVVVNEKSYQMTNLAYADSNQNVNEAPDYSISFTVKEKVFSEVAIVLIVVFVPLKSGVRSFRIIVLSVFLSFKRGKSNPQIVGK